MEMPRRLSSFCNMARTPVDMPRFEIHGNSATNYHLQEVRHKGDALKVLEKLDPRYKGVDGLRLTRWHTSPQNEAQRKKMTLRVHNSVHGLVVKGLG
jgi:hypothetical protein